MCCSYKLSSSYLLLVLLLIVSYKMAAQTNEKRFTLGFGYSHNFVLPKFENAKGAYSSILLMPQFGYNFNNKGSIGIKPEFQTSPKSIRRIANLGIFAFLSPYFRYTIGDKFIAPFIEVSTRLGRRIGEPPIHLINTDTYLKATEYAFGPQISPGFRIKFKNGDAFNFSTFINKQFGRRKFNGQSENYQATNIGASVSFFLAF